MKFFLKICLWAFALPGLALIGIVIWEGRTSRLEAFVFSRWGQTLDYSVQDGSNSTVAFPVKGPEDFRKGYVQIPSFTLTLLEQGYSIEKQALPSPALTLWTNRGLPPPYSEKKQAGLRILDRTGRTLYASLYPRNVYPVFDSIPSEVVNTLLFIENQDLLDSSRPWMNPAVEWFRFGKALSEQTKKKLGLPSNAAGGSTLATQIEKYRHSGEGRTSTPREKMEQMLSASVRTYREGERTLEARRRIVLQYINSVPLAAIPGYGEVNGLGDGLATWYGTSLDTLNHILRSSSAREPAHLIRWGYEYRKVLNLFIAHRRPSDYLLQRPDDFFSIGDSYVRLLAEEGVLSPGQRDAALAARPMLALRAENSAPQDFAGHKAVNAVRTRLAQMLNVSRLYDLDRLDLTASTSLDGGVQSHVAGTLKRLGEAHFLDSTGLRAFRLLDRGDPQKVIYSFTLYETVGNRNLLRVQADNYDQPLDINDQVKLELGSTAKLRTLVHYLEILTELHHRWSGLSPKALRDTAAHAQDVLSRWSAEYLAHADTSDNSLFSMLQAGMERKYSASPREVFFTGGGEQTFANFEAQENSKTYAVRDALRNSINLSFVRLMRDVVNFHVAEAVSKPMVFDSGDTPERRHYLEVFAKREGELFLFRFFKKYQGLSSTQAEDLFFQGLAHGSPRRLAAAYQYLHPDSTPQGFQRFVRQRLGDSLRSAASLENLFSRSHADWTLADYGFVAGAHPLELWLVGHLQTHEHANWSQIKEAAGQPMLDAYVWLFHTSRRGTQDVRIREMMEMEAFVEIHHAWQRLGYPFGALVPSLGTAIGSSGDRPNSLAALMGILLNDGRHYSSSLVQRMHFATGTPYETAFMPAPGDVDTLLSPEICRVAREALLGVVENGTAARGRGAFKLPDGTVIPLGGKTGTGDQRFETYGHGGQLIESRVVNRTATFVFFLGDRFFGTLTAYVQGPEAAKYGFTSALPVRVLVLLQPYLTPLLLRPPMYLPESF